MVEPPTFDATSLEPELEPVISFAQTWPVDPEV